MRTTKILSAAMLGMLMAACSQERLDLVEAPSATGAQRPVAENVTLSFDKGVDTRVTFDGEYHWAEGDKVGALLMDEINTDLRPNSKPEEWAKLTWLERYKLSDYIHTDYPFSYKGNGVWQGESKMLEGNYFFAHPYEGYGADRQLVHTTGTQTQVDGTKEAAQKAFGENQYWIGYSQIKAGDEDFDRLTDVQMVRVLAPIQFTLKSIATQSYDVTKVVVKGTKVQARLRIDPTHAKYIGEQAAENGLGHYNLATYLADNWFTETEYFNYANYLGLKDELFRSGSNTAKNVYNVEITADGTPTKNYKYENAIRAIVNWDNEKADETNYAELTFDTAQTVATGEEIYGVIFVNPLVIENAKTNELLMDVYTTTGVIRNIDLTVVNTETDKAQGKTTVITNKAIAETAPDKSNSVRVQFDDNSIQAIDVFNVKDTDDLSQLIAWNAGETRSYVANLVNDVTLTKAMYDMLKAAPKGNHFIVTTTNFTVNDQTATDARSLTIAADVPADVLDYVDLSGTETFDLNHDGTPDKLNSVDLVVLGTVTVNSATNLGLPKVMPNSEHATITVAEGATLNIAEVKFGDTNHKTAVINHGTVNVNGNATSVWFKNEAVPNAKEPALINVKAELIVAKTSAFQESVNASNGKIVVSGIGTLTGTTDRCFINNGEIDNQGDIWNVINKGKDAYVLTSSKHNHFAENSNDAVIELRNLTDDISFESNVSNTATILFNTENAESAVATADLNAAGVTKLILEKTLLVTGSNTQLEEILVEEGKSATLQGGTVLGTPVMATLKASASASAPAITVNGGSLEVKSIYSKVWKYNVKKNGNLDFTAGVNITTGNITLGSREDYTDYGAAVTVKKGVSVKVNDKINRDTKIQNPDVKPTISNAGTMMTADGTVGGNITVSGNPITSIN